MVQILEQQHLEKCVCFQCKKYLSVGPVKVYDDGFVRCGRCCKNDDGGIISLYDKLAKHYVFKCINNYEGCRKLLLPSEVSLHEINCLGGKYNCPKCEDAYVGTGYDLIQHFKHNHNLCVLKKNYFYFSLNENFIDREQFLYIQGDLAFFVLLQYLPSERFLYISIVSLKEYGNIKQGFQITSDTEFFRQETGLKPCLSLGKFNCDYFKINLNIFTEKIKFKLIIDASQLYKEVYEISSSKILTTEVGIQNNIPTNSQSTQTSLDSVFRVYLTDIFKQKYPTFKLSACGTALFSIDGERIELTCSNCKHFMGSNVFTCISQNHTVCWDCKAWCSECESLIKEWNKKISTLNEYLKIPCKWKCGYNFLGGDLRKHELVCDYNKKKCPVCSTEIVFHELKRHIRNHTCELIEDFKLAGFLREQRKSGDKIYFSQNSKLFKLKWTINYPNYHLNVTACEDMKQLELVVVLDEKKCAHLKRGAITVNVENNPKFYIKLLS